MSKDIAPCFHFLGIKVNTLRVPELNSLVGRAVSASEKIVIGGHNLHSLYVFHHDDKMKLFHDRCVDYVHIDGMGIVLLGRILGCPLRREDRVTYLDWIDPLLKEANTRHWKVFYLGMRSSICERLPSALSESWPELNCRAFHWDCERRSEAILDEEALQAISEFRPQLLLVGMGNPRQERWILENYERIDANVILTCGAAMDYVVGAVSSPPRWAGRYGIEWLLRLINEPGHLWRRYLLEPWHILWLLFLEVKARAWGDGGAA
jgi:N-acetylglucosaminyldiphosphoundecaprenol N-acetyl-beta-D-mannosaminyltransferase